MLLKPISHLKVAKLIFCRSCSSKPLIKHYDIVIAGGGMVGTTLACTLGRNSVLSNKNILLLEAGQRKPFTLTEKYANRVVSLNPGTKALLNDIGAWKHIDNGRFATVKRLQVWDALSNASITFGDESSSEDISYIVENDLILDSVNKELDDLNNVTVLYKTKSKRYCLPIHEDDKVKINLESGEELSCDLLLGCDGYNSLVRKEMGAKYLNWNYNQMAIVATIKYYEEFNNVIAWQRWLPTGPVALLPLTKTQSSVVWCMNPDKAKNLLGLTEPEFTDALNSTIWREFGRNNSVDKLTDTFDNLMRFLNCPSDTVRRYPPKIEKIEEGSRAAFPLGFGHATSYISRGVVLVGDAAHRVHPLAGQGVNLGFGDVECLNKVLEKAVYSGSELGSLDYLREYETARQRHNIPTMVTIEGLHRLYTTEFTPVVLLRSLGLQFTHALGPLKKMIVNQASI